ncbi:MAG TPA: TolC family protein [Longimicrobiales bacterium]|nr:TolC family protein [Longimicrobiales bacterium]
MPRHIVVTVVVLLLMTATSAEAQDAPATLREYYEIARTRNPMLRATAASVAAAAAAEPSVGLPPDPQLQLGIMNASLPGLRTDMPGAMAPSILLMQMLPFPGKLRLSSEIARQTTMLASAAAEEMWWAVRGRTAMTFYDIYQAERQLEVMQQTLDWLTQYEQIALTMYATGAGNQTDVLRAGVEVARMKAEIERTHALRAVATARLNAVLDRAAETTVPRLVFTPRPADIPDSGVLERWAVESRPLLMRGQIALDQARTREALARRDIWPDVTLGVQYGQRGSDRDTERMGSVMLGFNVPVFAARRQLQLRHQAAALTDMTAADLAALHADVRARIGELLAELSRTRTLITLYRSEVLPQAAANVTAAFASYRVGRVDFMTLVDAQMTQNRYSQELYALLAEYGWRIAELELVLGRDLPATTHTIGEDT